MQTETFATASATSRITQLAGIILRAIMPRWMHDDDPDMPVHRRMGAWEAEASQSARDAVARMHAQKKD
jgi:hypothetical protein